MKDLNHAALDILSRWIVACDNAARMRRQVYSEIGPAEPEVGFMGDDPASAPSWLLFQAALREKHNATRAMRRFARRLVATDPKP